jgi:hypothetical protein
MGLPNVQELVGAIVDLDTNVKQIFKILSQQRNINDDVNKHFGLLGKNLSDLNARIIKLEQTAQALQAGKAPVGSVEYSGPSGDEPADLAEGEEYVDPVN